MAWNSIGSMIYLACQWLITILVVRLSDSYDAAGQLALAMAVANIFMPIGMYKIRAYQVSDVEEKYTPGQYIVLRIITVGMATVVMFAYTFATCPPSSWAPVFIYGAYCMGLIVVDVFQGIDQQKRRMDIIGISYIARGILSLGGFAATFYLTGSLELALAAMTVLTFLFIALYDVTMTHSIEPRLKPDFTWKPLWELLKTCFPAVVALIFCTAIPSVPRQVLDGMYGSDALGGYASIAAPVLIIQMGAQYIYSPLLGVFAEHFVAGDAAAFKRLLAKVSLLILLITVLGIAFFALLGQFILNILYGSSIDPYLYLLQPIVICTVITAYIWFITDLLIVVRDMSGNFMTYLGAFIVCVASMYPLLAICGLNGASFCIILSFGIGLAIALPRLLGRIRKSTR